MTGLWWRPQWSSFLLLFWKQRTMWPLGIMEPQEGKLPAYEDQTIGLLCVQEIITLSSLDTETLVFVRTADVTLVNKETVILLLGLQLFCAKLLQFCLTLCNPIDCSPLGSSVHGILQARILEWVAMPSSRGSSQPRGWTCGFLHVPALAGRFFTTRFLYLSHLESPRHRSTCCTIPFIYEF